MHDFLAGGGENTTDVCGCGWFGSVQNLTGIYIFLVTRMQHIKLRILNPIDSSFYDPKASGLSTKKGSYYCLVCM